MRTNRLPLVCSHCRVLGHACTNTTPFKLASLCCNSFFSSSWDVLTQIQEAEEEVVAYTRALRELRGELPVTTAAAAADTKTEAEGTVGLGVDDPSAGDKSVELQQQQLPLPLPLPENEFQARLADMEKRAQAARDAAAAADAQAVEASRELAALRVAAADLDALEQKYWWVCTCIGAMVT